MAQRDPVVVRVGDDPSPEWNQVRLWISTHYQNSDLMKAVKADDDELDEKLIELLSKWQALFPDADAFEIGVDEKVGVVRLRLTQSETKARVSARILLENGVDPRVIELATVYGAEGKETKVPTKGKVGVRFDVVKDVRSGLRTRPGELDPPLKPETVAVWGPIYGVNRLP